MNNTQQIERLYFRYAYGIDAGDLTGVAQLLDHASILDAQGNVLAQGAKQITQFYESIIRIYPDTGTPKTQHVVSNVLIEEQNDETLRAIANYSVFQKVNNNKVEAIICGQYHTLFKQGKAGWEFYQHKMVPLMVGDMSSHLKVDIREISDN